MIRFKRGRKMLAGVLTFSMLLTSNSFVSLATEISTEESNITSEEMLTDTNIASEEVTDLLATYSNEGVYLNYLVVGNPLVGTPGSQYVLADVGDGTLAISTAKLTYVNEDTGASYEANYDTLDEGTLLFNMDFNTSDMAGSYRITSLDLRIGDKDYSIDLDKLDIDATFGVDTYVESNADAYVEDEEVEEDNGCGHDGIEVLDAEGNEISFDNLQDALSAADNDSSDENPLLRASTNPNLVVVIDPGHGGSDPGAQGNGMNESDLCLKIANYCKEKLSEYSHVEIYMTRTTNTYVSLEARTALANEKNADVFICIHINSYTSSAANGAEVFYPNGNYIPAIGTEGKDLAQVIQNKLVALGFANRGIKIRNSENGSTYPNGSSQDYLNVIWRSKRYGFPAVLIEHGFISNAHDAAMLGQDSKLREMGYADALAIAEYYGLSKDGSYGKKPTIADTIRDATKGGTEVAYTPIMNKPSTTVDKMVAFYNSKATYPSFYGSSDAPDIRTFCQMYYDEAVAEGIDPGVAFAQMVKETGFLRFGGQVNINQYNFAGIGAVDGGAAGASFPNVRTGIRAQIQHLKAYASVDALVNPCVDPRYSLVTKGCASFVEHLGIKENPYGKGWATSVNYGYSIVNDYMSKFCDVKKGTGTSTSSLKVSYSAHVQNHGWQNYKTNGTIAGTEGLALRLEGIKIKLDSAYDLGITYQTHIQNIGWQDYKSNDAISGTTGRALRLEAIRIKLTGSDADKFDVIYRVHAQNYGWLGWAKNGQDAGTAGFSYRLEAIQIYVVPKGVAPAHGRFDISYIQHAKTASNASNAGYVNYRTHVQNYGDQSYVYDGSLAGTSGEAKRLEAININVNTDKLGVTGGITYQTHVQNDGWQDWKSNGEKSGTSGRALRLEAIRIKLTGELETKYDIYYRSHIQNYGWLAWAKNGEVSGSEGKALRMEAMQIVIVPKGNPAPNYYQACNTSYVYIK